MRGWGPVVRGLERAAHNGYVAGSNPAGPTNPSSSPTPTTAGQVKAPPGTFGLGTQAAARSAQSLMLLETIRIARVRAAAPSPLHSAGGQAGDQPALHSPDGSPP